MLRIHQWLIDDRYPNCRKIADEFEVSAKTVQRDINFMRDQLGLPIEYDRERFGFRYTRLVTGFPAVGAFTVNRPANPWRKSFPPPVGEMPSLSSVRGPGHSVRIRFDSESASAVGARTWHATQLIQALPDGCIDMTLRVRDEWEIARWVLSWGAHAWVIDPPRIRARVREIARQILSRH